MAESQGWSSSLKRDIYKILKKEWDPDRETIISMGIHLEMDTEQVDLMLGMAHMEPLCAKNAYECAVMFILEDVKRVEEYGREAFEPVEHAVQILRELGMEDEAKALAGTREEERELDT